MKRKPFWGLWGSGVGLLLFVAGCGHSPTPPSPLPVQTSPRETPQPAEAVQFVDVKEQAGIRFRHVNGASGKWHLPETMGSGGAFLDFDHDGWLDVLLLNGQSLGRKENGKWRTENGERQQQPSRPSILHSPFSILYHNNRNGTFTDVTRGSGLDVEMYANGCCIGDYDNDGYDDVFITTFGEPNRLFHNEGGTGKFRDVTTEAGVGDGGWGSSCAWLDFDNDGLLDLFVCRYLDYRLDKNYAAALRAEDDSQGYIHPRYVPSTTNLLYRNLGNGCFADVSAVSGFAAHKGKGLGVVVFDYDRDGWLDVAVANDTERNFLFHNVPAAQHATRNTQHATRHFEEVGMDVGVALAEDGAPKAGMGIDAADIGNDGRWAVLVSNFHMEALTLFHQREGVEFWDETYPSGMGDASLRYLGFGLFFFDFDNDADADAFVANGHIFPDIAKENPGLTYGERNLLFRNHGGRFEEIGRRSGKPFSYERVSRGAAYGDYDNDGDLDVLVSNNNQPAELLRNDGGNRGNWLQVELRGTQGNSGEGRGQENHSPSSNRDGIGAQVIVQTGKVTRRQWVRSGSSYLSQSMLRLHFGLGKATKAEKIEVRWSSGKTDVLKGIAANRRIFVEEGKGVVK